MLPRSVRVQLRSVSVVHGRERVRPTTPRQHCKQRRHVERPPRPRSGFQISSHPYHVPGSSESTERSTPLSGTGTAATTVPLSKLVPMFDTVRDLCNRAELHGLDSVCMCLIGADNISHSSRKVLDCTLYKALQSFPSFFDWCDPHHRSARPPYSRWKLKLH